MHMERVSEESFAGFARRERPGLVRYAFALVGDRHAAEDVAQDAFSLLWRDWDRLRRYDAPVLWLRRVAWHLAITRSRRLALERQRSPLAAGRERADVDWPEPDLAIWNAVLALPERQRVVVTLRVLEDRSYPDIAAVLGCSLDNARQLLHRGLATLRTSLASHQEARQ